jgi:hypothetical protein
MSKTYLFNIQTTMEVIAPDYENAIDILSLADGDNNLQRMVDMDVMLVDTICNHDEGRCNDGRCFDCDQKED